MSSTTQTVVGRCEPDDARVIAAAIQATSGWPPMPVFVTSVDLDDYANDLRKLDDRDLSPVMLQSLLERSHVPVTIDRGEPPQFAISTDPANEAKRTLRVSLPGYSADGGAAALYVGSACGPACGQAVVVLLERAGDAWKMSSVLSLGRRKQD